MSNAIVPNPAVSAVRAQVETVEQTHMYISGRIGKHILIPSELVLLRGVLDRLCLERQVAPDTDEGSDLALRVFYFYEQGVVDEEELFIAASGRRGRPASIERKLPGTVALAATSEASTAVQV